MLAYKEDYTNVIDFRVINGTAKYTKDGRIKNTVNNNSETRWVSPIVNKSDVIKIIDYLTQLSTSANNGLSKLTWNRNRLLFIIGINVGLRVSDLVKLKWKHIFNPDMTTFVDARNKNEKKTGKNKLIIPNKSIQDAVLYYLDNTQQHIEYDDYVFISFKTNNVITDATVEKLIKKITSDLNIQGNYNTHSLRKTYAYHKYMMYINNDDPLALVKVQKDLNHRNSSDTARYLGITRDEQISSCYAMDEYWN